MADPLSNSARSSSYAEAGVNIDAGNALVEKIKPFAKATARKGADGSLGGFGALFDLKAAGFHDPILVSTTDGVGTKLKVAIESKYHKTVGIDLVAMCVNDLLVQGAEPLLFLDYYATGKLDVTAAAEIIEGIAEGCKEAGCALVGGETAEMPGMYSEGDYDLAGFALGAVERQSLLPREDVRVGDSVLGVASSGLHSNGFSLVRKIVAKEGLAYDQEAPFDHARKLGEALLIPTRIYVRSLLKALKADRLKAVAHITGGGLLENIPRVLPKDMSVRIDASTWQAPAVFKWLAQVGNIDAHEMARTFNCGIGMVLIVAAEKAEATISLLEKEGEKVYKIGKVEKKTTDKQVILDHHGKISPC